MVEEKPTEKATEAPAREDGPSPLIGLTEAELEPPSRFIAKLRNYFLTGLIIVGPVGITIYILWWFVNLIDTWVKPLIPHQYLPENYLPFSVPGVGLLFAIFGLIVVGALTANLFGRTIVSWGEMMLDRMPVVRGIYKALKQIFETVLSQSSNSFKTVGLVEFPRKGLFSLVFVSTETTGEIKIKGGAGKALMTVFMPTTPNPTTGFLMFVPTEDVILLDMTVEDAAKLIISAGLIVPDYQQQLAKLAAKAKGERPGQRANRPKAPAPAEGG